jgi:NAD(P)-dependent dehydrogenase (short-subunit alcohol dehydrogenase family)
MFGGNGEFQGKIALVTGASRGIGKAIALGLANQGAHVLALAKTRAALEELDDEIKQLGGQSSLIHLNLAHAEKVNALGPSLYQRFQRLDILVGNAAVLGPLSPVTHIKDADWAAAFDINVHANWRLIRSLDPILRLASAARVLFVTSGAAERCRAYWGPYSATKAALNAIVKTYAHEVETTAIRANLLDPGRMRTRMRAAAYPGENPETLPAPEALLPIVLQLLSGQNTANGEIFEFKA